MFAFSYAVDQNENDFIQPPKPSNKVVYGKTDERYIDHWGATYVRSLSTPETEMKSDAYIGKNRSFLDIEEKHLHLVEEGTGKDASSAGEKAAPYTVHSDVAYYSIEQTDATVMLEAEDLIAEFLEVSEDILIDEGVSILGLILELQTAVKRKQHNLISQIDNQMTELGIKDLVFEVITCDYALDTLKEQFGVA